VFFFFYVSKDEGQFFTYSEIKTFAFVTGIERVYCAGRADHLTAIQANMGIKNI
jgi:hypothetical protein